MEDNEKHRLAILVVLYNKEINKSTTISSLFKSIDYLATSPGEIILCIWNNGPKYLKFQNESNVCAISVVETIDNEPLSVVYNSFLKNHNAEKYLILDHDTNVSAEYINECLNDKFDYKIPKIVAAGVVQSPKIYDTRSYGSDNIVLAIGSGVCLSKLACKNIERVFGNVFDERFYFYGVDSTFFLRLYKLGEHGGVNISECTLKHSLSRLEVESEVLKMFRVKERSYDQALTLRYYFSRFTFVTVMKKVIGCVFFKKNEININHFFYALITGKHYKSKKT